MIGLHAELLGHVGDQIRLADGLPAGDRHRLVGIGGIGKLGQHEFFPRHGIDRAQHRRIADAAPAQREQELHAVDALVARVVQRLFLRRILGLPVRQTREPAPVDHVNMAASRVMNGSSVRSSRSAVTEIRLLATADKSVPSRGFGRSLRAKVSQ